MISVIYLASGDKHPASTRPYCRPSLRSPGRQFQRNPRYAGRHRTAGGSNRRRKHLRSLFWCLQRTMPAATEKSPLALSSSPRTWMRHSQFALPTQ